MPKVRNERRGAASVLTIERPERRNAVDTETAALLLDGLRRFEADDEARVLVLTGEGAEAFCAGADLKAMAEAGPELSPEIIDTVTGRAEGPMGFTRLTASKPTVAAISGGCLAGGWSTRSCQREGTSNARSSLPRGLRDTPSRPCCRIAAPRSRAPRCRSPSASPARPSWDATRSRPASAARCALPRARVAE